MSNLATIDDVRAIETPQATETWQPVSHSLVVATVGNALKNVGYRVDTERYELDADGRRMFAVWTILNGAPSHDDHKLMIGFRNAHDKAFALGMAFGTWMLVCANMEFGADYVIGRKHTSRLLLDLPGLVGDLMGKLGEFKRTHEQLLEAYRRTALADVEVHDILIRSVDDNVISNAHIAKVLGEWRQPQHEEFEPRNVFSLMNAYTEVFKGTNTFDLSGRTRRLHGLLGPVVIERGNDPQQIILDVPKASTALQPFNDAPQSFAPLGRGFAPHHLN
jgi:hypothetical protein